MQKLIRLENVNFSSSSSQKNEVNKILEFNPKDGILKNYVLQIPQKIPFHQQISKQKAFIKEIMGRDFDGNTARIIHNHPVVNAFSAPFKIYIDITSECSLNCPFCLSDSGRKMKIHMPLNIIRQIATEAKKIGVMYIKIGGGDPFLHPDIAKIIALFRSAGCFLSLSTNSVTTTPEIARLLAKFNVKTSISLEGMEKTNDSLREPGHFRRALEALEILKKAGANVLIRTTLLRQNLGEIPELVELAKSRGVKAKFAYCRPAGRAVLNQMILGPQDSFAYFKVLEYLNDPAVLPYVLMDEGMMFDQPPEIVPKLFRGRMCGAANRSMHIDVYGKVSPCIFLGPAFSYGKIYVDGTIEEFWRGEVGNKFHDIRAISEPKECGQCSRICKYECLANRFYFHGDFKQQDPNCLQFAYWQKTLKR